MVSGIGLDVIDYSGANRNLFAFKWYNPWTQKQELKCYGVLWRKYFKDTKAMYIPFMFDGIQQVVHLEDFRI